MDPYSPELLWLVVVSFIVAFILSFGIGANDVANSFGTSVGAKVISLRTACVLATIFEIAGAVLIGYKVSDTLRKVLIDVNIYQGSEKELLLGYLSSLCGSGTWLIVATFFRLPISGTHSIVGATIGFSLVARGSKGLQWSTLFGIVSSWFISPLCSGLVSVLVYVFIRSYILNSSKSIRNGLRALPIFYGLTIGINVFSVVEGGPKLLHLENFPFWSSVMLSGFIACTSAIVVHLFVVPRQHLKLSSCLPMKRVSTEDSTFNIDRSQEFPRNNMEEFDILKKYDEDSSNRIEMSIIESPRQNQDTNHIENAKVRKPENILSKIHSQHKIDKDTIMGLKPSASAVPLIKIDSTATVHTIQIDSPPGTRNLSPNHAVTNEIMRTPIEAIFAFLQILTAIFGSFAHGGNDVSNAIGPLVAIWLIFAEGSVMQTSETPFFILLFGGIGISIGLCVWGRNVIKTVGEDLTKITPSTGFSIEIGSSMTVLLASKLGVPISTTHCKVGSVVFVGCISSSKEGVDWSLFKNIIFAWVITLPVSAILSAGMMYVLRISLL